MRNKLFLRSQISADISTFVQDAQDANRLGFNQISDRCLTLERDGPQSRDHIVMRRSALGERIKCGAKIVNSVEIGACDVRVGDPVGNRLQIIASGLFEDDLTSHASRVLHATSRSDSSSPRS